MKVTWLRHGIKQYGNNEDSEGFPQHDSILKSGEKERITTFCEKLFEEVPRPSVIYTSPFARTIETSYYINNYIGDTAKIVIDKRLSEFLGNQRPIGNKADIYKETSDYGEHYLGTETITDVKTRAIEHMREIAKSDGNILVITHGILIKFIYQDLTGVMLRSISELSGISVTMNPKSIKMINC